ncbi:patatin-like phospholipase family protein [Bradyrhizobium sp. LTSP885]|uniref:patatin-like phospholipase family protein n=1 Tax=Bradyrhizobium sp. LTSP885 TaxID=1619232 RepID=UPI0005C9D5A5|nr:patatin-like phospholipase family protein [Bradyrhizobium sp. LTSP885]
MPFGSEGVEAGLGLALSGGGFRATLFHIGTCWRLIELGILPQLTRVSSVSGGSVFAGVLASQWTDVAKDPTPKSYQDLVVAPLRAFCRMQIDTLSIGEGLLSPLKSASDEVAEKYSQFLFRGSLNQLVDAPAFVFNATNLQTGRSFRFSKPYMGDYRIGLIRNPTLSLAQVVAASSAFPPFLSPVILDHPGHFEAVEGADLNGRPEYTDRIFLSDGGVYDNLGLETVWNRYQTVLVSDAGAPFGLDGTVATDWVKQTLRALDVATDQARALRKRALIDDFQRGARSGTYWGIDTRIANYQLPDAMPCVDQNVQPLAALRTRLNPFDDTEQEQLINWGYALCDAAIRKHAPQIVKTQAKPTWPCPGHPLG